MLWAREMEEVVWQELGARKVELADNPEPTKGTVDDEGQGASTSTTGSPKKLGDIDVSLRTAS